MKFNLIILRNLCLVPFSCELESRRCYLQSTYFFVSRHLIISPCFLFFLIRTTITSLQIKGTYVSLYCRSCLQHFGVTMKCIILVYQNFCSYFLKLLSFAYAHFIYFLFWFRILFLNRTVFLLYAWRRVSLYVALIPILNTPFAFFYSCFSYPQIFAPYNIRFFATLLNICIFVLKSLWIWSLLCTFVSVQLMSF